MTDTAQQAGARRIDRMMVRLEHLDKLLSLAGEVIITSSTMHELQRDLVDSAADRRPVSETNLETVKTADESTRRISQDLHDLVMAIRMVEIGETFRLFRRPIRDLCRGLGKEVDFVLKGENVLIDKALAERLVDPLLHVLRNAIDHGVETPLERVRAGKSERGTVSLRAVDTENHTELIITDDGCGIDGEKVLERARTNGLVGPHEKAELIDVLMMPGFSTRESATSTSGRGVGLDILQSLIREFDGNVELKSTPGKGTTFRLQIPKLRAVNIIDALAIRAGEHFYALDIEKVVALQAVDADSIHGTMERERFIKYLGDVIAVFDLQQLLGGAPLDIANQERIPLVIIEGRRSRIAVIVDEYLSPQKLVNVPLDRQIFERDTMGIAGTCIFAGGRVGLTVDVDAVVASATGDEFHRAAGPETHTAAEIEATFTEVAPAEAAVPEKAAVAKKPAEVAAAEAQAALLLDEKDVKDLVDELCRGIAKLQDTLLSLEDKTDDVGLMHDAFRRLHAAKGNFTMLNRTSHAHLAHQMETILDLLRNDRIIMSTELMDLLLDGVSGLAQAAKQLPGEPSEPSSALLDQLETEIRANMAEPHLIDEREVLQKSFAMCPTIELQLIAALKRKEHTYETFIRFQSGRQAEFLLAYLLLRRLGMHGTILATLPEVDRIEQGECGNAIKVLWTSSLDASQLHETLENMARHYNIIEHQSLPTTVFRYEAAN